MDEEVKGVWVTYLNDPGPIVGKVFERELDALRDGLDNYANVVFVPFGMSVREAIDGGE